VLESICTPHFEQFALGSLMANSHQIASSDFSLAGKMSKSGARVEHLEALTKPGLGFIDFGTVFAP
jgi:hypothetical protein